MKQLKTVGFDSKGAMFERRNVSEVVASEIESSEENVITRKNKSIAKAIKDSTKKVDESIEGFGVQVDKLQSESERIKNTAKKAQSSVKVAADSLKQGLARITKEADFDSLERYVILLERAEVALKSLAEIEKTGKLKAISNALSN